MRKVTIQFECVDGRWVPIQTPEEKAAAEAAIARHGGVKGICEARQAPAIRPRGLRAFTPGYKPSDAEVKAAMRSQDAGGPSAIRKSAEWAGDALATGQVRVHDAALQNVGFGANVLVPRNDAGGMDLVPRHLISPGELARIDAAAAAAKQAKTDAERKRTTADEQALREVAAHSVVDPDLSKLVAQVKADPSRKIAIPKRTDVVTRFENLPPRDTSSDPASSSGFLDPRVPGISKNRVALPSDY